MDAMTRPSEFGWRAFARYDLNNDAHDLYVAFRDTGRQAHAVSPLVLVPTTGVLTEEPTLKGAAGWGAEQVGGDTRGFLQTLVDTAWDIGIRPRRLAEHQSELTAVRYHLEDMRALAKVPAR